MELLTDSGCLYESHHLDNASGVSSCLSSKNFSGLIIGVMARTKKKISVKPNKTSMKVSGKKAPSSNVRRVRIAWDSRRIITMYFSAVSIWVSSSYQPA